jgi:hypothetical protein
MSNKLDPTNARMINASARVTLSLYEKGIAEDHPSQRVMHNRTNKSFCPIGNIDILRKSRSVNLDRQRIDSVHMHSSRRPLSLSHGGSKARIGDQEE